MGVPEPWKQIKSLGQGKQGQVILVHKPTEPNQPYALKLLARNAAPIAYERFGREIEAIQRLDHPFVPKIISYSTDAGQPYYVMEYFEGARSLKDLMQSDNNPFFADAHRTLKLGKALFEVVGDYAEKSIVHRDLSPGNILVLPDHTIRVIDFGLCQMADHELITLAGPGIGTINYMSPECEAGSTDMPTMRSDFYSVGKILWSAITNQVAFAREKPVFQSKSMRNMFRNEPMTWHLQRVFEMTIRHLADNRWDSSITAVTAICQLIRLVELNVLPVEMFIDLCPLCQIGRLGPFTQSHMVFGNPNPENIVSVQCPECGFCFARNQKLLRDRLQQRAELE